MGAPTIDCPLLPKDVDGGIATAGGKNGDSLLLCMQQFCVADVFCSCPFKSIHKRSIKKDRLERRSVNKVIKLGILFQPLAARIVSAVNLQTLCLDGWSNVQPCYKLQSSFVIK